MNPAELPARIAATNRVNYAAMVLFHQLRPIFLNEVGQKVVITDGSKLLYKYQVQMPKLQTVIDAVKQEFPSAGESLTVCFNGNTRSLLSWTVSSSERCSLGYSVYAERRVLIGEVYEQTLTRLEHDCVLKFDYTWEGVREAQKAVEVAKAAFDQAVAACGPFAPRI